MGILKYITYFLILVALPLSELARLTFGQIAITLMDLSVILLVAVFLLNKRRRDVFKSEISKALLAFIIVMFFSLILNFQKLNLSQFIISLNYIIRWVSYAFVFFVVRRFDNIFQRRIQSLLLISGASIVLIGLIQYFLYPDLRNLFYLGWDEHLYRLFSWSFFDPNFAGIFLVLYLIFLLFSKISNKIKIPLGFFTLLSILLTYSRSAYLSLAVALTLNFLIKKQYRILLLFLLSLGFALIIISKTSMTSEGTNLSRTASSLARLDSAQRALTIFRENPILGVGFDSYRYAQLRHGFINEDKMLVHSAAGTDNSFLFVLATTGIVGLLSYLFLLYRTAVSSTKLLLLSLIAVVFDSLFINSLFYPPIMLWLSILAGIKENK